MPHNKSQAHIKTSSSRPHFASTDAADAPDASTIARTISPMHQMSVIVCFSLDELVVAMPWATLARVIVSQTWLGSCQSGSCVRSILITAREEMRIVLERINWMTARMRQVSLGL
uniref:Uncharacterized protein n=1 Tax=Cacopsylla melanoneura TaxID=428564 RepID=A0A8D8Z281_9HEMI